LAHDFPASIKKPLVAKHSSRLFLERSLELPS